MRLSLLLLSIPSILLHAQNADWLDTNRLDYSYDAQAANGPDNWDRVEGVGEWEDRYDNNFVQQLGNRCDATLRPSPLNVMTNAECGDPHEPLPRQINEASDCGRDDTTFAITPGFLRAYFPLTDRDCERPTLTFPRLPYDYTLLYMELHARSEHLIEGKRFDAELQMVHLSTASRGRITEDQLATVSLMIQADATKDDIEFQWLLDQWQQVADREDQTCTTGRRLVRTRQEKATIREYIQARDSAVDDLSDPSSKDQAVLLNTMTKEESTTTTTHERKLQFTPSPCKSDENGQGCEPLGPRRRMFPYNLWTSAWYYFYFGSMTSPPCTDNVTYNILDKPRHISRRQYKQLAFLLTKSRNENCQEDSVVSPRGDNFRPVREMNSQVQRIVHCTPDNFGLFMYAEGEQ